MAVDVEINASFNVNGTMYNANMSLPTSNPTKDNPFVFLVTSTPKATSSSPSNTTPSTASGAPATLLTVAVGGPNEVYVAVSPPTNLIADALGNGSGSNIVNALRACLTDI